MNTNLREFKLFESGTQSYVKYNEGDVVTFRNSLWIGGPRIKVGRIPTESGSGWTRSLSGDITGVAVTADAGLTGTMWTRDGFHYQDITIATGGITTAHIADNAITSSKIADGAILGVDVAVGVTLTNPDITGDAEVFGNVYITGTAASALNTAQRKNPVLKISGTNRNIAIDCGAGGVSAGGGDILSTSKFNYAEFANQLSVAGGGISAQSVLIEGYTGEFVDIISVKGLSAQSGVVDGYTGNFNNIVAHGGISASGITLGVLSSNYLGLIASVNAISAGSLWVDIQQAGAINLNNELGFGVSAEGNYIRGYTGTFKNVELVQGLSAQDGLIEGYTGEFQQVSTVFGISCGGGVNIYPATSQASGNMIGINIYADSSQNDGKQIQIHGKSNTNKSLLIGYNTTDDYAGIRSIEDGVAAKPLHLHGSELFIDCGISAEGATFGGGVIIHGGVSAGGISTDNIHVVNGISAGGDLEVKNIWIAEDGYIGVCGDTEAIYMNASGGQFTFSATAIDIKQKLRHSGDADTYLDFTTDQITLQAGGTAYIDITSAGTNFADTDVVRPNLKDYSETVNAIGTITGDRTISLEDGNVQTVTVSSGAIEFDFDNWPATGIAGTVTLIITNGGSQTVTWESAVKWPGDNAPALTSSGVDIVSFMSIDAGTTVYGFVGGINFS